jgi:hypothetical protein
MNKDRLENYVAELQANGISARELDETLAWLLVAQDGFDERLSALMTKFPSTAPAEVEESEALRPEVASAAPAVAESEALRPEVASAAPAVAERVVLHECGHESLVKGKAVYSEGGDGPSRAHAVDRFRENTTEVPSYKYKRWIIAILREEMSEADMRQFVSHHQLENEPFVIASVPGETLVLFKCAEGAKHKDTTVACKGHLEKRGLCKSGNQILRLVVTVKALLGMSTARLSNLVVEDAAAHVVDNGMGYI